MALVPTTVISQSALSGEIAASFSVSRSTRVRPILPPCPSTIRIRCIRLLSPARGAWKVVFYIIAESRPDCKGGERNPPRLRFSLKRLTKRGPMCIIKVTMQGYRSGHNEAVLKTVWARARVGSNPTPCGNRKEASHARCLFDLREFRPGSLERSLNPFASASKT